LSIDFKSASVVLQRQNPEMVNFCSSEESNCAKLLIPDSRKEKITSLYRMFLRCAANGQGLSSVLIFFDF